MSRKQDLLPRHPPSATGVSCINADLTSVSAEPDGVKGIQFTGVMLVRMVSTSVPMVYTTVPMAYTIVPARIIIPVSSRPPAVPAAVAGIMAINELATLSVAFVVFVVIAILPVVAFISESGPR